MTKLRFLGLAVAIISIGAVGCGDDDRSGDDAGPDTSGVDVGPRPDVGPLLDGSVDTGMDTGTTPDTGGGTRGSMCPMTPCNPVTAAGCAPGEACYFASTGEGMPSAPLCAMAGMGVTGTACTNVNDCQEGLTCIGGSAGGTCQPLCCAGQNGDCPTGGTCAISLGEEMTVMACSFPDGCDLLAQTGCMGGDACYPMSSDGATVCSSPGDVADGATCEFSNSCMAGSACVGSMEMSICRRVCDIAMEGADCEGEETCNGLMGFDGTGICVPPA